MSGIGVQSTLNERWNDNAPECAEDWCASCGDCLGCFADNRCPDDAVSGHHLWANEEGEVRLV